MNKNKGFTLVHLLLTIAGVIGFATAMILPTVRSSSLKEIPPESEASIELDPKPQIKWRSTIHFEDRLIYDEIADKELGLTESRAGVWCNLQWKDKNGLMHNLWTGGGTCLYKRQIIVKPVDDSTKAESYDKWLEEKWRNRKLGEMEK